MGQGAQRYLARASGAATVSALLVRYSTRFPVSPAGAGSPLYSCAQVRDAERKLFHGRFTLAQGARFPRLLRGVGPGRECNEFAHIDQELLRDDAISDGIERINV